MKISEMTEEQIIKCFKPEEFGMNENGLNEFVSEYLMYCTQGQIQELAYQLNMFAHENGNV